MPEIGLFDAMYSARALRRLKPDPVPEETIGRILDAAIRAPSAGNAQHWAFVVVRDAEQRRKLGAIYRKASDIARAIYRARGRPPHMTEEQYRRFLSSGAYLWDHMGDAPVLLIPCLHDRPPPPRQTLPPSVQAIYQDELAYEARIRGASIYPAVQNIILACRAFGLGTVVTTNHLRCEDEVKQVLGLPKNVSTYALMPIGYPHGKFGPARAPAGARSGACRSLGRRLAGAVALQGGCRLVATGRGWFYTRLMVETRWRHIAALRLSRAEMYMLPLVLLGAAALAFFAFRIVGFLGIGLLGVLIGFIAVQVDLEKEGVIGPSVLHAQQMMARQNASPSERAAHRSEMQSFARPLLIAKIISAALVILAFGGFFYL